MDAHPAASEWGWDDPNRELRRALSDPEGAAARDGGADPVRATLEEPAVPVDPTRREKAEQLPTYNVYSIDGDVTGPLVYVNYGRAGRLRAPASGAGSPSRAPS